MIMKNSGGGEIVQVQGGHILRSIGRKDRHSKVFTAKGPRDRRVRLSAHTAIQFYDVQDRLGYDRPSKAVDWLMKKARDAINKLADLPPWNPDDTDMAAGAGGGAGDPNRGLSEMGLRHPSEPSSGYAFQVHGGQLGENPGSGCGSSFLAPSMDTQPISDPMKSFFPMSSVTSSMDFQDYPHEIMGRTTIVQTEDLCLSLHSLQDPNSGHHHHQQQQQSHHHHSSPSNNHQTLFAAPAQANFEANYPRLMPWEGGGNGENREGYIFGTQPVPPPPQPPFLCQSSMLSQRGPLQSSCSPSVHAWNNEPIQETSISGGQFGLFQFQLPPQIQSEAEEQHGVALVSHKPPPPSTSPNSHH
ncbi:hypothetical protein U1Q18_001685 [Sarracenia purpurea var. burkii]